MRRLVLMVLLAAFAFALMSGSANAGYYRDCGSQRHSGGGWYFVKAHGVGCGVARQVARTFSRTFDARPLDFHCTHHSIGIEALQVACRNDSAGRVEKVRFEVGA